MTELTEFVYLERDNVIDLVLKEDGVAVSIVNATRVRLELYKRDDAAAAAVVVDSSITPTAFDWATLGASGVLSITLGATLAVEADYLARLVIYDAGSPNGLIWAHERTTGCGGTKLVIRALDAADAA